MNARQWVEEGRIRLETAGVSEPLVKAEWWVREVLGVRRDELDGACPPEDMCGRLADGFRRLERHEPLQHVIGHVPFCQLSIRTDARALIPRPETEEMVSRILNAEGFWFRNEIQLADVGTGSGCIALALASARAEARVVATDCSEEALSLAAENARRLHLEQRITFMKADLLEGVLPGSLDGVVSNPPYIAGGLVDELDPSVRKFEPRLALDGGVDGLEVIRRLVVQAFTALKRGGRLWVEIGDEQSRQVQSLLGNAGYREVEVFPDMYGQARFAEAVR